MTVINKYNTNTKPICNAPVSPSQKTGMQMYRPLTTYVVCSFAKILAKSRGCNREQMAGRCSMIPTGVGATVRRLSLSLSEKKTRNKTDVVGSFGRSSAGADDDDAAAAERVDWRRVSCGGYRETDRGGRRRACPVPRARLAGEHAPRSDLADPRPDLTNDQPPLADRCRAASSVDVHMFSVCASYC